MIVVFISVWKILVILDFIELKIYKKQSKVSEDESEGVNTLVKDFRRTVLILFKFKISSWFL